MKKWIGSVVAVLLFSVGLSHAIAHYTETLPPAVSQGAVLVSNGYDYNTTSSAGAAPVAVSSYTIVQLGALAPSQLGTIAYCSTCIQTPICASTGTATGAWAAVSVSTSATTGGFGSCK